MTKKELKTQIALGLIKCHLCGTTKIKLNDVKIMSLEKTMIFPGICLRILNTLKKRHSAITL